MIALSPPSNAGRRCQTGTVGKVIESSKTGIILRSVWNMLDHAEKDISLTDQVEIKRMKEWEKWRATILQIDDDAGELYSVFLDVWSRQDMDTIVRLMATAQIAVQTTDQDQVCRYAAFVYRRFMDEPDAEKAARASSRLLGVLIEKARDFSDDSRLRFDTQSTTPNSIKDTTANEVGQCRL